MKTRRRMKTRSGLSRAQYSLDLRKVARIDEYLQMMVKIMSIKLPQ